MKIPVTENKTCIYGALIEGLQRKPLFNEISICGEWCTRYISEYNCCVDILHKYIEIQKNIKKLF